MEANVLLTALNLIAGLALGPALARYGRRLLARRGLLRAVGGEAAGPAAREAAATGEPAGGAADASAAAAPASGRLRRAGDLAAALATAALFALMHLKFGASGEWAVGLLLTALAVVCAVTDLTAHIIPNGAVLGFGAVLLVAAPLAGGVPLGSQALGALGGGGLLLLIALLTSGKGMGMGDVKLLTVFGWVVGFPGVLLALFLASAAGAAAGLLQLARGRRTRGQTLAFGPFLAIGTLVVYMYGKEIIHWYLQNVIPLY
ncbi:prepilin peptidase [Paenibacillus sp. MBLB2552]|uniref:Prepilin peptidase n=1 Tax=Paenibacillus mellifer TaxID=2937794 RepID=A0A9X1XY15_9BACL|nr:prepilin peptidase [Paenibacillus mellifer]MCK8487347.1 prepilin peptidase [Paenibacillus mellifer]